VTGTPESEKTPEDFERDMAQTRESITEKVSLLETQVLGTVHAVTDTVGAVKDAITAAPTAVSDTVKQTVEAVRETMRDTVESVKETVRNFSVAECVRNHPWAAVGTTGAVGFLTGLLLGGGGGRRSVTARAEDAVAANGWPVTPAAAPAAAAPAPHGPGIFGELFGMVGKHVREIAEQAISSAMAALKRNVGTAVPQVVDHAVQQVTQQVTGAADGASRGHGPSYSARA